MGTSWEATGNPARCGHSPHPSHRSFTSDHVSISARRTAATALRGRATSGSLHFCHRMRNMPRSSGGYLIDVGSAQYIIDGKIGIVAGEMRRFVPEGIELVDGTILEADLVVMATGFKPPSETYARSWARSSPKRADPSGESTRGTNSTPCGAPAVTRTCGSPLEVSVLTHVQQPVLRAPDRSRHRWYQVGRTSADPVRRDRLPGSVRKQTPAPGTSFGPSPGCSA